MSNPETNDIDIEVKRVGLVRFTVRERNAISLVGEPSVRNEDGVVRTDYRLSFGKDGETDQVFMQVTSDQNSPDQQTPLKIFLSDDHPIIAQLVLELYLLD